MAIVKRRRTITKQRAFDIKTRQAKEKYSGELRSALKAIGEAAKNTKTRTVIPLKVVNNDMKEVLLASLVVKGLKRLGFGVYWRRYGRKPEICEYCVTWRKDLAETPEGFQPVE